MIRLGGLLAAVWLVWTGAALAAPPLEAYGRLPAMASARLSPSGDRYAYLGLDKGERKVVVRSVDGKPLAMAPIGEAKVRTLRWAGESHLLIGITKTYNRNMDWGLAVELFNVLSLNIENGKQVWLLTDGVRSNGISREYGLYEKDGQWWGVYAAMAVTRTRIGDATDYSSPDLFKVNLDTGSGVRIANGSETDDGSRDWLVDAQGKPLVQADYAHDTGGWKIKAFDGGGLLASGKDSLGDVGLVSPGRAPGLFIYQQRDLDGVLRWREMPVDGGSAEVILDRDGVEALRVDPLSGLLLGYDAPGDLIRTVAFNPLLETRLASLRKAFAHQSVRLVSWSTDLSRLLLHTSGGTDSGAWWLIDIKGSKAEELGWDYPDIGPELVSPSRIVSWKASDGQDISGVLTLPLGGEARGLPVVVMPHGGPATRDTLDFDWMAQAFASRGYAVLQPNFRGSTGYGQAFEVAGYGQWGGKMQTDVSDGLAALAAQGVVDPRRACVVGASYGGYVALAGVTLQQGLYRCAVSHAGVADLQALWRQKAKQRGGGITAAGRSFLATIGSGADLEAKSPITLASRADAPVLLLHGQDDTVVVFEQSVAMEKALKAAGKPVQLIALPGEDHWLSRAETRAAMLKAAVSFVEANNPVR